MTTKFPAFAIKIYMNLEKTQVAQVNADYGWGYEWQPN